MCGESGLSFRIELKGQAEAEAQAVRLTISRASDSTDRPKQRSLRLRPSAKAWLGRNLRLTASHS